MELDLYLILLKLDLFELNLENHFGLSSFTSSHDNFRKFMDYLLMMNYSWLVVFVLFCDESQDSAILITHTELLLVVRNALIGLMVLQPYPVPFKKVKALAIAMSISI